MTQDALTPAQCLAALELGSSATPREIKLAYRRLAQQCHPDKHGGREDARRKFVELSTAYRILIKVSRAADEGHPIGSCAMCREFGMVVRGPDGVDRCSRCALYGRHRYLPAPVIVVVRCVIPVLLLGTSGWLMLRSSVSHSPLHAAAAFGTGLLGLVTLAVICLRVVYCAPDKRRNHSRG